MVQAQDGVQCGLGHPSPSRPPGGLCGNPSPGTTSPAPGAGRARRSFQGSPRFLRLRAGPGSARLCCGAKAQLLYPGLGLGTGRGPERPTLLPTYVPHVGAQADKLQNSLELRKTGPAVGCAPSLSAAPGPWLGAPGKGEEAAAAHGPGAGRCCLGEGASLTSSRAAISHAVRTLNLKGPCVPASERAGFCF